LNTRKLDRSPLFNNKIKKEKGRRHQLPSPSDGSGIKKSSIRKGTCPDGGRCVYVRNQKTSSCLISCCKGNNKTLFFANTIQNFLMLFNRKVFLFVKKQPSQFYGGLKKVSGPVLIHFLG
jgi:hypothetical protein